MRLGDGSEAQRREAGEGPAKESSSCGLGAKGSGQQAVSLQQS